jgi:hypothetical protein
MILLNLNHDKGNSLVNKPAPGNLDHLAPGAAGIEILPQERKPLNCRREKGRSIQLLPE